ncbi:MAG: hypothetical protein IJR67_02165 [Acholeplasmatales bacterium]|nr:hypothetical protein [Acholeplasmatales bacterium]
MYVHVFLSSYKNSLCNKIIEILLIIVKSRGIVSGPTKTFNMPGLKISHVVIKNKKVYSEFLREFDRIGYSQQSIMGIVGTVSAYNKGENWLNEVKSYIYNNIIYIDNYLKNNLPKIKLIKPEGTYLLWLDFRDLKLSDKKINDLIMNKSKLWLDSGLIFGQSGRGFQRINVATNRKKINILLERLTKTFKDF